MAKRAFTLFKNLTDLIEGCKLPEALDFRKKLGYNHDIMVREEQSRASKIIKLFPNEKKLLNKKVKGRKPDIWFVDCKIIIEIHEGDHVKYDSDDEKEREYTLKEPDCVTV